MASSADLDCWRALGGKVTEVKKRKRFISPTGEEYTTWQAARTYLKANGTTNETVDMKGADEEPVKAEPLGKEPAGTEKAQNAALPQDKSNASKAQPANGEPAGPKKDRKAALTQDGEHAGEAQPARKQPAARKKAKKAAPTEDREEDEDNRMADAEDAAQPGRPVGSGRQVAQGSKLYRDRGGALRESKDDRIAVKAVLTAQDEAEALAQLAEHGAMEPFRLVEFSVIDGSEQQQPLETHGVRETELFLSGTIYPKDGPLSKAQGRVVERFGPVKGWSFLADAESYQIRVKTAAAQYMISRPASSYRKLFAHLTEQADIAVEVQRALLPSLGGSAGASFDEVIARVARAKVGKSYSGPREALRLNGKFVLAHLLEAAKLGGADLASSAFVLGLHQEMAEITSMGPRSNGITICDAADRAAEAAEPQPELALDSGAEADLDFARQLQAKLDAQEARGGGGARRPSGKGAAYIKISESEIANDYPEPAPYQKEEEETDELLLLDEEMLDAPPEDLPRRLLTNFAVYNAEGLYASLELLPMWSGVEPDAQLFASGRVLDDDGEWAGGQSLGEGSGSSSGGSSGAEAEPREEGMWLALSQIQEWVVEFGCDMLFISFRTDVAWYRLSKPTTAYAPWFGVVLKTARLAVNIISILSEEARASRLSFNDIVKRLAATEESQPTFVSKKADAVERFVVVHGQIILNQFKNFPKKSVANSAFVGGLKAKMELRRHCKLYTIPKAKARLRGLRANPMRDCAARAKPMTATATRMVKAIWHAYFVRTGNQLPGAEPAEADKQPGEGAAAAVDDDVNAEDDEAPEEDALAEPVLEPQPAARLSPRKLAPSSIAFIGLPVKTAGGKTFYRSAKAGDLEVSLGDIIAVTPSDEDSADVAAPQMAMIQALWQAPKAKMMQVRLFMSGAETVLTDAANPEELFATADFETRKLTALLDKVNAERLRREFKSFRAFMKELDDSKPAGEQEEGQVTKYFYRSLYLPSQGMFCELPANLELGTIQEEVDEDAEEGAATKSAEGGFVKGGVTYRVGDCFYVPPDTFEQIEDPDAVKPEVPAYVAKSRFHKGGANAGLRAFGVAKLLGLKKTQGQEVKSVKVQRFYRPEDISADLGYRAGFWDIYASTEQEEVDAEDIQALCQVRRSGSPTDRDSFVCVGTYDRKSGKIGDAPEEYAVPSSAAASVTDSGKGVVSNEATGKGKSTATAAPPAVSGTATVSGAPRLAAMDIFAGCGGLSCGMHRASAAETKWAIEYERPAAEAFKLNNPSAHTFCDNCNVLLSAAMDKAGLSEYCDASEEAKEAVKKLDSESMAALPGPGEVDFLCGGPPCQGYSGMNRFNKGVWSLVQNSMVMAYLSYADFYRPRYFLLENVRNFVSHNKSHAFRLTLRSLLDMGYQVRFGVLNAGNFGVSQSRKRTFIWGVAPGSALPAWPQPLHVFRSPQLTIKLPGGAEYTAVPQMDGAPLRAITVKDAIGDLPPIVNGSDMLDMPYSGPPISAFQAAIRGRAAVLRDHICKEMNELNLERCRCIPKAVPGADWRVLQEIVDAQPERTLYKGQPLVPWCLPNTADRHNGWRGLFGRLDYNGHFPTSVTDPQPMGKVGQVFHPEQDRIVSVRECARAQGFPDEFQFYGNVHNKHRQIGNAVPVPLAYSLGRQLRAAVEETAERQAKHLLAAQMM